MYFAAGKNVLGRRYRKR